MSKNEANTTNTRREDWETPNWLFERLNSIFQFELDLCAIKENTKCNHYITPENDFFKFTSEYFASLDRGRDLEKGWWWCNPPYGKRGCSDWVDQLMKLTKVVCLLPASVGAKWFIPVWKRSDYLLLLNQRLRFVGAPSGAQFDSCISIIGDGKYPMKLFLDIFDLNKFGILINTKRGLML